MLRAEAEPAAVLGVRYVRGLLELGRGRDADALAAFQAAERLAGGLATPQYLLPAARALLVHALVRLGETERAERALAGFGDQDRGEICIAAAVLRLARHDPRAATAALAPVLDGSAALLWPTWLTMAFLLEAIAREALGDEGDADQALERALDWAEPDGALVFFLWHPAPGLLERHARVCARHAALVSQILTLLTPEPASPDPVPRGHAGPTEARRSGEPPRYQGGLGDRSPGLIEPLSRSEMRVLRYLPTNLSAPEIARELSVSVTTVRTHISHLFAKLGAHRRTEAVARARDLGLLAPSPCAALVSPAQPYYARPGSTVVGVNVATPWPASALHPAWRTTAHASRLGRRARICPPRWPKCPGHRFSAHLARGKSSQLDDADPSSQARRLDASR